jgi:hypothetical protein
LYDKTFPNKPHIHYVNPESKDININTSQELLSRLKLSAETPNSLFNITERARSAGTYETLFAKERILNSPLQIKSIDSLNSTGDLRTPDGDKTVFNEPLTANDTSTIENGTIDQLRY